MKNIIYQLIKFWIKSSLHLYYGKIKIHGLEKVPLHKAVLFLPNHQNALLDPLLIAVHCNRKPYFLTRSDVFKSSLLNKLFDLVRMIPIYRIRDGRDSLKNNDAVFERCAKLLGQKESLLMFPEADHNLQRRVRPLSKGFTRILFKTLEQDPKLDIRLVPIGLNYLHGTNFPDKVGIYFGQDIAIQDLLQGEDRRTNTERTKLEVFGALQKLTTHIPGEHYQKNAAKLKEFGADFLDPVATNKMLEDLKNLNKGRGKSSERSENIFGTILKLLFILLNVPVVLIWKLWVKPRIWEPEFTATLRFATALLAFPIYYLLLFTGLSFWMGPMSATLSVVALLTFNWAYVKFL